MGYNKQSSLRDLKYFISFLKREGIFISFLENKTKYHHVSFKKSFEFLYKSTLKCSKYKMLDRITSSFDWKESDEGFRFWSSINHKWLDYLNKK